MRNPDEFLEGLRRAQWCQARIEQFAHQIGIRHRRITALGPTGDPAKAEAILEEVRALSAEADELYAEILQINADLNKPAPPTEPKRPGRLARLLGRTA